MNTWLGSIVGGIPPLIGWAAATGGIHSGEAFCSMKSPCFEFSWKFCIHGHGCYGMTHLIDTEPMTTHWFAGGISNQRMHSDVIHYYWSLPQSHEYLLGCNGSVTPFSIYCWDHCYGIGIGLLKLHMKYFVYPKIGTEYLLWNLAICEISHQWDRRFRSEISIELCLWWW